MKSKILFVAIMFLASLLVVGLPTENSSLASPGTSSAESQPELIEASADCADCESRCDSWISKCKEGGQYACYKAAACLCKCNLDEGGCGSSKEALRECYEENERLARELNPEKR
jgi:hypothetical protein